jgi:flagellar motor switch protein FliN
MSELAPQIVDEVVAAIQAAVGDIAESMQRGLDLQGAVTCGQPVVAAGSALTGQMAGPGLAMALIVDDAAALVLISDAQGKLPGWCANPDATGKSKLSTLAQELGMQVLPERFFAADFRAGYVGDLAAAAAGAQVPDQAAMVPLEFRTVGGDLVIVSLLWPAQRPDALLQPAAPPKQHDTPKKSPLAEQPARPTAAFDSAPRTPSATASVDDLPPYSRSLLRIQVPVVVTLAEKRQALGRIVELGPGSIIQFEKSCEESLQLVAGGHTVACGEVVKVGDKFGLRITAMVMPGERFQKVTPKSLANRKAAG